MSNRSITMWHPTSVLLCRIWLALLPLVSFVLGGYQRHDSANFTPDIVLRVTAQDIAIDCETRHSVIVNGSAPGPPIYLKEGFTTWIRVHNDVKNDNLTMHWHGLSQSTAPFSDGTPLVSQWPIPPGNFFDYEVHPNVGEAGTYFYHSHVGMQAISAQGPLIIEECGPPPYAYDEDIPLLISDYYNKTDESMIEGLLANPFRWTGETKAILMNGHSGHASFTNATDYSCSPLRIEVDPGKTYRMRFIGGTAITLMTAGIENHENLTIIEADGAYSKPVYTDHVQVASGQRFSVLFKAKTLQELQQLGKTNFWIRYENRERPGGASGYALLSYNVPTAAPSLPKDLPDKPPVTLPAKIYDWLEYKLTPIDSVLAKQPFPTKSTRTVVVTIKQRGVFQNGSFKSPLEWENNMNVWQEFRIPSPYLVNIYKQGQAAIPDYNAAISNGGWDPKTQVFPAKVGEVLDIIWMNNNGPTGGWDIHPMHGHGGHYWDMGSGNGTYDADANAARIAELMKTGWSPLKRDTTMLYRYAPKGVEQTSAGWRAWRVKVEDAGLWMMHCHILMHMVMGMQTVWAFGDAVDIVGIDPSPYISGYLEFGGSAYGNDTDDPIVNHFYPPNVGDYYDTCKPKHPNWMSAARKGKPKGSNQAQAKPS